jgi:hypothetical protein
LNKSRTSQQGLGIVEIVVACLVVAAIAAAGVVLVSHNKKHVASSTAQKTTQTATPPDTSATTQSQQPAQKYLAIKEWGISLPYPSTDTLSYSISSDQRSVYVTSQALAKKYPACTNRGAGSIEKLAPGDDAGADGASGVTVAQNAKANPGLYTYYNGYYYQFVHDQAQCGPASVDEMNQANDLTRTALANAQAASN